MSDDELLRSPAVAALLGVSGETVRNWVKKNQIPHILLPSGQARFRRSDIDAILEGHAPTEAAI